jgi:hypothetical protein
MDTDGGRSIVRTRIISLPMPHCKARKVIFEPKLE